MERNLNNQDRFIDMISKIVYTILDNENVLRGEWHNGKVDKVNSSTSLTVFVDGSKTSQIIPCNPSITFESGDEVFVHYVNGDSKNKFVPYKRGI